MKFHAQPVSVLTANPLQSDLKQHRLKTKLPGLLLALGLLLGTVAPLPGQAHPGLLNRELPSQTEPVNLLSAATAAERVSFVAFGDTGSGAKQQFDVEKQMEHLYAKSPFSAVLLLGDIIYPAGDVDRFGKSRYLNVYEPLMSKGVPFYDALGNHDVLLDNVVHELKFYGMPNRYYSRKLGSDHTNNNLVELFILDTNVFVHDKPQAAWLDNALKNSTARWKIVAGHHPLYSSGEHGKDRDLALLRQELEPILVKYKVPLYLAGHDHDYERFLPQKGILNIVSGGGGAYIRDFKSPQPADSKFRAAIHHFLQINVTPNQLTINAINKKGEVFDTVTLHQ